MLKQKEAGKKQKALRLREEMHCLYVAATRSRKNLYVAQSNLKKLAEPLYVPQLAKLAEPLYLPCTQCQLTVEPLTYGQGTKAYCSACAQDRDKLLSMVLDPVP